MMDFQKITLSQTNCFLLLTANGCLLVDCGNACDEHALTLKLKKLGLSPSSIQYLLLTHHHSDHCGLLSFLVSANPNIKIIMSQKCARYLELGFNHVQPEEKYASTPLQYAITLFQKLSGKLSNTFLPYYARSGDILLGEEFADLLPIAGIDGIILPTPGHTEDSISLVVGENAFVGDAARTLLNFLGAAYEPILIYNRNVCLKSWERIIDTRARLVHPSHGESFDIKHIHRVQT